MEQFNVRIFTKYMEQSMQNEGQEFAVPTLDNVKVYEFGVGVIEPTGEVSDAELAEEIEARQKPVEDPHAVCFDERDAVGTLTPEFTIVYAEKQPVRQKMAGGALVTATASAKVARWSGFTQAQLEGPVNDQIDVVADYLVEAAEPLGAHCATDTDKESDATKCGAADYLPEEHEIFAEHGNDPAFIEKMQNTLGSNFDESMHRQNVANAREDVENNVYAGYRPRKFTEAVLERGGVVEVLNAENKRPDIDPANKRHGHFAEGLKVNDDPDRSNDRDSARIPFFQADAPAIVRVAQKMASSEEEFSRLLHAEVAFQFAVEYKLTKNMREVY